MKTIITRLIDRETRAAVYVIPRTRRGSLHDGLATLAGLLGIPLASNADEQPQPENQLRTTALRRHTDSSNDSSTSEAKSSTAATVRPPGQRPLYHWPSSIRVPAVTAGQIPMLRSFWRHSNGRGGYTNPVLAGLR